MQKTLTLAQITVLEAEAQAMYRAHVQRAAELHSMDADYAGPCYCPYVQDWADCLNMCGEIRYWLRESETVAYAYSIMLPKRFERARKHPLSLVLYVDPFQPDTPCWMH